MHYNNSTDTRSLYIHWPFCPYKCHFCPFVAIAGLDHFMTRYHNALIKEIEEYASKRLSKAPLDTIFFGGGTPSTYPDNLLLDTFGRLKTIFVFDHTTEITIEVNPGAVRAEQLPLWKEMGINRLSIGVQGLKDNVLNTLNRKQSSADVFWLLDEAKKHFDNVSVDLILGLPGVSAQEWKDLLAQVVTWPITHVSIYFLTVHEDTPLYFKVQTNQIALTGDEAMVDLYVWSIEFLARHGIHQYEVSNFSKEGYESRHNSVYWERKPYKGLGLGACSFDGLHRIQNEKNLMKYLVAIEQNTKNIFFEETLTKEQIFLERIMLGLRKTKGIIINDLISDLTDLQKEHICSTIAWLQQNDLLCQKDGRIILTSAGLAVQNEVIVKLTL